MRSRLQIAKQDIVRAFDERADSGKHVFSRAEIAELLEAQRGFWRLAQRTTLKTFLDFLIDKTFLERVSLSSAAMPPINRYAWKEASPYEIALSLGLRVYLSHGSAVFLHGLNEQIPNVIYVNREQSPKPVPVGDLTQEGLDRAFASSQRVSKGVYQLGDRRVVLLSGKATGNLGVVDLESEKITLRVASIERTLIDITVRPTYAGGPNQVLNAYKGARDQISVNVLISYLKKLDYKYPYAQAIGYYMSLAGYPEKRMKPLMEMRTDFNFYLEHGLRDPDYDVFWRVFIPKGFAQSI